MDAASRRHLGRAALVVAGAWLLHAWLCWQVMRARQVYEVPYPHLYAPDKHPYKAQFDAVQRAHQNTLETLWGVQLLVLLVAAGPYGGYAAPLGGVYLAGRALYAHGYGADGPEGRTPGALLSHAGDCPLLLLTPATARQWAAA